MKLQSQPMGTSRRNFLRRAAVGGLTALTATLVAHGRSEICVNDGLCPGCPAYDECDLPRALARKQSPAVPDFKKG